MYPVTIFFKFLYKKSVSPLLLTFLLACGAGSGDVNMMLSVLWLHRVYCPGIHTHTYILTYTYRLQTHRQIVTPYLLSSFSSSSLIFIPPSALRPSRRKKNLLVNLLFFSARLLLCALHLPLLLHSLFHLFHAFNPVCPHFSSLPVSHLQPAQLSSVVLYIHSIYF